MSTSYEKRRKIRRRLMKAEAEEAKTISKLGYRKLLDRLQDIDLVLSVVSANFREARMRPGLLAERSRIVKALKLPIYGLTRLAGVGPE